MNALAVFQSAPAQASILLVALYTQKILGYDAAGIVEAVGDAVTLFDSTGLAIQDLAITAAALQALRDGRVEAQTVEL
jgi:NADPH:quinone reductase-like Zn-dependent oxidoreductase